MFLPKVVVHEMAKPSGLHISEMVNNVNGGG